MLHATSTAENAEWVPTSEDIVQYIQSGRVKYLPKRKSKEVRIFVSSTFTDMYVERNMLFKSVYPKLQSYCQTRWNVDFQAVDMRWGVQSGATNDHSAANLCMAELRICQERSLGPNFVLLLGERYGTRQLPTAIPETEFADLLNELHSLGTSDSDMELLQKWFLCDNNSCPPIRRLQPLDAHGTKASEFSGSIEPRLLTMLRAAADKCFTRNLITRDAHRRYFWSVTDEEVHNGIITANDVENRCLCFSRKFSNPNLQHPKAWRFFDLDDSGNVDEEVKVLRQTMHDNARDVLGSHSIKEFIIDWCDDGGVNEQVHASYLNEFCEEFYSRLTAMIDKTISKEDLMEAVGASPLISEIVEHDYQAMAKLSTFQGRDDIMDAVKSYLESDSKHPLIIWGESGYGKTSIMATASLQVFHWLGDPKNLIVVRRFLGTSPESSNYESLLRGVVTQVMGYCGLRMDRMYFDDPQTLLDKLFALLPRSVRLIIFLDSIDQLSSVGDAYALKWIPVGLPENVRLVISTLSEDFDIKQSLWQRRYPQSAYIVVDKLNSEVSKELFLRWLSAQNRCFTDYQMDCITSKLNASVTSPLYVKLLFDIFKSTPSYMDAAVFAKKLEPLSEPRRCIEYIFEELCTKHGRELVNQAIALLQFSNHGLAENELLDVLSLDDDVLNAVFQFHVPPLRRLPTVLWRRIHYDMSEYIVERDSRGTKVLWWYHRHFIEAAADHVEKYSSSQIMHISSIMVDYFTGKWAGGKPKPFIYPEHIVRKLQLLSSESEEDRFVPAQPNHLSNGKLNTRKIDNLSRIINKLPSSIRIKLQASEVLSNIQMIVGMFTLFPSGEAVSQLKFVIPAYDLESEMIRLNQEMEAIQMVIWRCCATGSAYPKSLPPIIASHLLPFFGVSTVVDNLLRDIYSSGLAVNALAVRTNQLETMIGTLLFEIPNEHHDAVRSVLELGTNSIVSVSTKVILADLSDMGVSMRFSPKLPPEEHFNFLTAASNKRTVFYFAASQAVQPVMHVFSVLKKEYLGFVDCRLILERTDFRISDLRGFEVNQEEFVAVSTTCHCGVLIFNLHKFHSPLYHLAADTVIAVVPGGSGDILVLQPRRTHRITVTVKGNIRKKEITVESSTVLGSFLGNETVTFACYVESSNVFTLATEDRKLCVWSRKPFLARGRLIIDSPAHHINIRGTAMVVCSERFIYVILDCLSESIAVNYRLSKAADLAGFMDDPKRIIAYGLGMMTTLRLSNTEITGRAAEIRSIRAHSKPVTGFIHSGYSTSITISADGGLRCFVPFKKSKVEQDESLKCKRMEHQIDLLRADGDWALSVSKKARQVAVWDLKSGILTRRLAHPESVNGFRDAAVSMSTVVTVDDDGSIFIWNLVDTEDVPRSTLRFPGLRDFYVKPDGDVYLLAASAMSLLSSATGTIIASRVLQDHDMATYGLSASGIVIMNGAVEVLVDTLDGGTHFQRQLSLLTSMRNDGVAVNDLLVMNNILIICCRSYVAFCDYARDNVILTTVLRKPVLLKSSADVIAIQSGLKLNFFSIDNGVSDIGHVALAGFKDRAVISQDGLYCLILEAPRLLRLLRVADLQEIGIFPCDCDVTSIEISRDGRHVLAGLFDTRLMSFLIVDPLCASHKSRTEGILQKPTSDDEAERRAKELDVIANGSDNSSDDEDEYDDTSIENINDIIIESDSSEEYRRKVSNYVADVKYRFWRSCAVSSSAANGDAFNASQDSSVVT